VLNIPHIFKIFTVDYWFHRLWFAIFTW